ncbi:GNAT family N-acetyltransferase [Ideonella sp.]|uniref:GNAT family N-acetyltransferase n=1 Tax=Ideonella sp. TaxID=1929293 RepID=UPI002B4A24C7|nr:GNAT family N-acetyltransferase [Ideonella sp.]HJV67514.1 GNAT family N-acetyltransferase [Ideonella sp.]
MVHREVLRTRRLRLRWFEPTLEADQRFVIELLNDPDWIAHIGKRDVGTRQQAEAYLREGPRAMCERLGFGLYLVERLADGEPIGMCGLIKRDHLVDVDLGYAFVPAGRGQGYAREAAGAVMDWARERLALQRIVAIVTPANRRSITLLQELGFADEGEIRLPPGDEALRLLGWSAA